MPFPKKPLVFIASSALAIGVAIPGAMALSSGGQRPTLPAQVKSDDAAEQAGEHRATAPGQPANGVRADDNGTEAEHEDEATEVENETEAEHENENEATEESHHGGDDSRHGSTSGSDSGHDGGDHSGSDSSDS